MQNHTKLLLDIFYNEPVSEETKDRIKTTILPDHMPYKGEGYIAVSDVSAAEDILKEHVGEFEWEYYPGHGKFIAKEGASCPMYYGKFEVSNLKTFLEKLMDAGIRLYDFKFQEQGAW